MRVRPKGMFKASGCGLFQPGQEVPGALHLPLEPSVKRLRPSSQILSVRSGMGELRPVARYGHTHSVLRLNV